MKKLVFLFLLCFFGCYPDSMYRSTKPSISELTRDESWLALLWNTFSSPYFCKGYAISYPTTSLSNLYFSQGQGAIFINSDIISSLHISSNKTVLNSASGIVIKNSMFLYNSDISRFKGCKSTDDNGNLQNAMNGFLGLEYKSDYKVIASFYKTGGYMIFLDTGDPNFNPTDIYAVME